MKTTLFDFIDSALADKTNAKLVFEFYELNAEQAVPILELSGIDLTGYRRVLDNFAVRHIFKNHANHKTESLRGQIGVVVEDFLLIERVVETGKVVSIEVSKIGNTMIVYKLELEAFRFFFVEEVRVRRKELAVLTFYKQKIRKR
ncbi:MAG: hypothetical protein H7246_05490 [Phycisphaerae bacterium]|nr:hypothetical protein [Saprospiraceae bacterium]